MKLSRQQPGVDLIELLDRLFDKGAVVDKSDLLRLNTGSLWEMKAYVVPDSTSNDSTTTNKVRYEPTSPFAASASQKKRNRRRSGPVRTAQRQG